jgi:hypothetical protein
VFLIDGGALLSITSPDVTLNAWHHVAGTLDGSTGAMRLYVDGVLMSQTTTAMRPFAPLTGPLPGLGIGNVQSGNYSEYFPGLIDEVRISDTALTPDQFLIPEPSTCALALLGIVALLGGCRMRCCS